MGALTPRYPSLLKSGNLLHLSSSFLTPQTSSASWWGGTHFSEAQTSVPDQRGAAGGEGATVQFSFAAVPLRALALGGGAPGFSLGLRESRSIPPAQPQVGVQAFGALWATPAACGPLLKSWDATQRGAAPREPRLCAHRHPPPSCSG